MRVYILVGLVLALLCAVSCASPAAENTDVSYYPSKGGDDMDLARFRQLLGADDKDSEGEEEEKDGEEAEKPEEEEEEEKEENAEEERERPSEPEKEYEGLEKTLEQEDKMFARISDGMKDDAPSRNMHIVSDDASEEEKEKELLDALQAVKDQIVYKANQVKSQKRWVKEVTAIIESYVTKSRRVNKSTRELQGQIKELFRKKKQITNMLVQRKLEKKLKVANGDLQLLMAAMQKTREKEAAFKDSQDSIRTTIGNIETMLAKLRNDPDPNADKQTEEEGKEHNASL